MRINISKINSLELANSHFDIEINELKTKFRQGDYTTIILINIHFLQKTIKVVFKLLEDEDISKEQIYLVKESGLMFFMTNNQYGILDLMSLKILEQKQSFTFGFPERLQNSIILDDELSVRSYSINGKFIDEIPIDPPTERTILDGQLIYESPIFGRRKLKID